ncbi:hypothetical protein AXG93_4548s1200 [Marchantia polymorpha subsp. ruderalis]|uniref:Uncharacterized protein n=1 Tax=Marchantia polymorpha subsp. ruderalis TaxID=1480154 RepID=A0A176WAJ2_MARPO|nr:hypothetical protein AXG93_4548s1200 [Marchantia polymorpha subsp. ruderalis]
MPVEYQQLLYKVAEQVVPMYVEHRDATWDVIAKFCVSIDLSKGWTFNVVGFIGSDASTRIPVHYQAVVLKCTFYENHQHGIEYCPKINQGIPTQGVVRNLGPGVEVANGVAEAVRLQPNGVVVSGRLKDIKLVDGAIQHTLSQLPDNTTFTLQGSQRYLEAVSTLLDDFGQATELRLNRGKCALYWFGNADKRTVRLGLIDAQDALIALTNKWLVKALVPRNAPLNILIRHRLFSIQPAGAGRWQNLKQQYGLIEEEKPDIKQYHASIPQAWQPLIDNALTPAKDVWLRLFHDSLQVNPTVMFLTTEEF